MAWTTDDCTIMLDAMAGCDPLTSGSTDASLIHHAAALKRRPSLPNAPADGARAA
jgi:hypothetical protein